MASPTCRVTDGVRRHHRSDCKMRLRWTDRWAYHAVVSFCVFSLLVASLPSTRALEIDSDLVFDDGASNTNELHSNKEHNKVIYHKHRSNTTFVLIKKRVDHTVAPVASPIDEAKSHEASTETSEESVGVLKHILKRLKRGLFDGFFGSKSSEEATPTPTPAVAATKGKTRTRKATSTTTNEPEEEKTSRFRRQSNEEDNDVDSEADDSFNDLPPKRKPPHQSRADTDDEDDLFDLGGSGDPEGSGIPGGVPKYYRVTVNVHEPYRPVFKDRNSALFKQLAHNLSTAIEELYRDMPGRQEATLINIEETPDSFFCKLTFDLGSQDYYDTSEIRERLYSRIENYMKLGALQVNIDNFTFREFGGTTPPTSSQCGEEELECRSGECLPPEKRCNGAEDCVDGSDELGCPPLRLPSPAPTTHRPDTSTETSTHTIIDRCRGDDKVRCADNSIFICTVQVCDGNPDCPGGDDEHGCPENDCAEGEIVCDLTRCIPQNKRCDGVTDCSDETDEQECPTAPSRPSCKEDDFRCQSGECIAYFRRCDGQSDCLDGDDEIGCNQTCDDTLEFMCTDGSCIDRRQYCDGRGDCEDYSDETSCPPPACLPSQWQCDFGTCINRRLRCDGKVDCERDDSDERQCRRKCTSNEFECRDGTCIDQRRFCDKIRDCPDNTDEQSCPCTSDEFKCNNTYCIPENKKCDGYNDCQDGSDEKNCPGCAANEFMCRLDRTCIPLQFKCNRQQDCSDNSDEDGNTCGNPPCRSDQFRCEDGLCLNINQRCNQIQECFNGEDERGCATTSTTPPSCGPNDVRCGNGDCVPPENRCDKIFDCIDGADERDCGRCLQNEFRCEDGQCLSTDLHCDGHRDCRDGSDELDCDNCLPGQFQCRDRTCVERSYRCNGYPECRDRSDEDGCPPPTRPTEKPEEECLRSEFRCGDGQCINEGFRCDGHIDCTDVSDERNCPIAPAVTCSSREFTCTDGSCVDARLHCNGRFDCRDRSDEEACGCQQNEFTCSSGDCVPLSARCNRRYECRDGSDERDCAAVTPSPTLPPPVTPRCTYYEFSCRTGGQCVPQAALCNGRIECNDRSDEDNCPSQETGGLNLKTYPSDQIIKEIAAGREVVFQCRDEGPLRARVQWQRVNNLPLPPGSKDHNGRLEIPNIQMEHSGTYTCQAVGYPKSTPGSSVSVQLEVEKFDLPVTRPPEACHFQQATCVNGECIAKEKVCDGRHDCSDGSDEMRCSPQGCEPNEFRCANKKCVLKTWRCDSENDCGDNSDEDSCATNPPGSSCKYHEFQCRSGTQCIPRSFHCDQEIDCQDGSDEIGCSPVYVQTPPPPMMMLEIGQVFTITCTAIGVPTPEISWRLNWGHIPDKCVTRSVNGVGTLTCNDIQESDQGAYSCEAINNRGSVIAVPDTILVIKALTTTCPRGYFNDEARSQGECISCFCFGVATDCKSANLFTYQLPPPFDEHRLMSVRVPPGSGPLSIRPDFTFGSQTPSIRSGKQSFHVTARSSERIDTENIPYFAIPQNYHGNQLKSYGGYLKYTIRYEGAGRPVQAPDVILTGNDYTLVHSGRTPLSAGRDHEMTIRFFYGEWYKRSGSRPGGDIPGEPTDSLATREEIMMALGDVDNILIKSQYVTGPTLDTSITDITMDSAGRSNTGLGKASYVEECRCPAGYTGPSCENCAPGFNRRPSGLWLGLCVRVEQVCRPGQYGDPARGIACEDCPCPLTNPGNQFGRTCQLDTDNQVTCDCPPAYTGRRCEHCAAGYQGNPRVPGDSCTVIEIPRPTCDVAGSLSSRPDPSGSCSCKTYVTGSRCDQCQANSFNLDIANQFGCISCFCMGITSQCASSNWYRQQVSTSFVRSTQDFKLVQEDDVSTSISEGIHLNQDSREIIYQEFPSSNSPVYYWYLPSQFLGDKVTSYGGVLNYTVRYEPLPGGHSRNNAADVILLSTNDIKLLYFGRDQIEPNRPQTISVPILEQYWQADNGEVANREHMLMALADIEGILLKATYTTNTREAALSFVSMDIAEDRNTGQDRAVAVESCQCPVGYQGLSCEDCDVGYTRSNDGIYLGLCAPCDCHGHSTECDPETGTCLSCKHNTDGEQCDECADGYEGDATRGRPDDCRLVGPPPPCSCDHRGSVSSSCQGGQCLCKTNVEGRNCDHCRQGTFGLSSRTPEGCLECYCSGVTEQCQSSKLYRTEIPMQIIDSRHGFTLTDLTRHEVVRDGFTLVDSENEIGYTFPDARHQRLFWSLPTAFTGNKVTSYGGNLTVTQRYSTRPGAHQSPDQDVVIIGNGITLYWTSADSIFQPDVSVTYSVPLLEASWTRLEQSGPHPASRADLISVLSSLEVVLIRATHSSHTQSTHLSDVSLATSVPQFTGQDVATEVENCRCPPQYKGTSCELCAPGHYRDQSDRSGSILGSCKRCPCNNNEESCSSSPDGRYVTCVCIQGYTGRYCDSTDEPIVTTTTQRYPPVPPDHPTISITISEPTIQIVEAGSTVRYRCLGRSLVSKPVTLQWSKEGGQLPRDRAIDDRQGLLVITDVRVSDSGTYICSANDGFDIVTERAVLNVDGSPPTPPHVSIEPRFLNIAVGEPIEFRCEATGNPAPNIRWTAQSRPLNPESSFSNGVFRIASARKSDEGEYECIATSPSGTDRRTTIIYIEGEVPAPTSALTVSPPEYNGPSGQTIRLNCLAGGQDRLYNIRWSRPSGNLPPSAVDRNGVLTIYNASPADSGIYICMATSSTDGRTEQVQARVTIISSGGPPSVRMEPERQTVQQGTLVELRCLATGDPAPNVRWTKVGEDLASNVQVTGQLLRISNVAVRDRGVYVCTADNEGGTAQGSAIIEVERREPPAIEVYPDARQTVTAGGSSQLQCLIKGGIPAPRLRWSRPGGKPLSPNCKELPGGVLRFTSVTQEDAGQYTCHAENDAGEVTAIATLEIHSMPHITLLPSTNVQKVVGDRVRLECRATGDPQPTVAWTKHTVGATRYGESNVPERPQSAVWEITSLTPNDAGMYICTARNAAGVTEERLQLAVTGRRGDIPGETDDDHPSSSHTVTPWPPFHPRPPFTPRPSIPTLDIPKDVFQVIVGGRADLRCHVRGTTERIFLDWVRSDGAPMPAGYLIRDGVLYINNVEPSAAGEYSCLGISQTGETLFTAKSTLTVIAPPRIQLNPTRQVVRPGDNALITCSASGDQPMDIQWSALGRNFSPRVRVDQGRLHFTGIEVSDAGRYVCTASNPAGQADAAAEVTVSDHQTRPTVQAVQRDQSTPVGSNIELRCTVPLDAQGHAPQITWTRYRSALPRNARVRGEVLELLNVQAQDQGRYICEVRNEEGESSDYVNLHVEPVASVPDVSLQILPSQQEVTFGDTVDLRCLVTGNDVANAQVTWHKSGQGLESNAKVYNNLLRISDVRPSNEGVYTCSAMTSAGRKDLDYRLEVQERDVMHHAPATVETRMAPHGSTVVMDCRTDLEQPVTYSWSKQGGPLPRDSNTQEATLSLHDIRAADAGTYICTATNGVVKMDIPTVLVVTGVVPFFQQAPVSYMALPTLPDAYLTFAIEVSFKPESGDGMILYNGQQRGGGGDFISLGLNGSYIEFRFNVGSGPALIRSPYPINLGEWHTVKLHRTRKEGAMYVDGQGPIEGSAQGRFQGLDLVEPLYVGGVPDFSDIHRLSGFSRGFVGCISRLVIGSVEHELVRDATLSRGVTTCETCAVNPCQNQGVCQEAGTAQGYTCICPASFSGQNCDRVGQACYPGVCGSGRCVNRDVDGYDCYCPFGRGGAKCEEELNISEPAFADDAYLAYPTPKAVRRLKMALNINPRTLDDGVLLYCAQSDDGHGDFASLAIRDKRLEFRFDTGSGPAILRSDRDLTAGEWVTISAGRDAKEGHLSVNNETPVTGRSPGDKRGLNLRTPLYIGGFDKQRVRVSQGVGVSRGFQGCISDIQVAGVDMDMFKSLVDSANVEDCSSQHQPHQHNGGHSCDHNPCMNGGRCSVAAHGSYSCNCPRGFSGHNCEVVSNICESQHPCQNGGSCLAMGDSFKCRCPLGYAGDRCQNIADLHKDVNFNGDGYIEFRNSLLPHKDPTENEIIVIELTTTEPNGLIFWHGQEAEADGRGQDYLSLAVVDGHLEFGYELGSGPALIRSNSTRMDDGKRHKVILRRQGMDGSMEIDNKAEFGESRGFLNSLNTRGNIYIGGVENFELMTEGRYTQGFTGCIHKISFQDVDIDVGHNAVNGVNAQPCSNEVDDEDYDNDNDIFDRDHDMAGIVN